MQVDDAKKLGEWSGLCKLDKDGKARKVNACGVVVVRVSILFLKEPRFNFMNSLAPSLPGEITCICRESESNNRVAPPPADTLDRPPCWQSLPI